MDENEISKVIVNCAIEVHRTLGGPGLLEVIYEEALAFELGQRGVNVQRQVSLPITYKGQVLSQPLRMDMVVEDKVVVECKAMLGHNAVFESQVLTYLRLSGRRLGLLINFGEILVSKGIHRVVNGLF
jgi:GxxExxY protein